MYLFDIHAGNSGVENPIKEKHVPGWKGAGVEGCRGGGKTSFKDCLQQSKINLSDSKMLVNKILWNDHVGTFYTQVK